MRTIPARTVYVDPIVRTKPNCRDRLERVLPHVDCGDVRAYDEAARERFRTVSHRRHGKDDFGDDALLFFTDFEPDRAGWYYHLRDAESGRAGHGGACQTALELNLVAGCVFRCDYCGFGRAIHFSLDVEHFMDGLDEVFAAYPAQRLYKYSNMTDLPPFEPEFDAVPPMVRRFARESDRFLMLFTKSDKVDFLLDLDHRGHTIISWSLSSDTVSRRIDRRTAPLEDRLTAMRKVQQAGYLVRARLSPIVPVRNWRREYERLFEDLYAQARPDIVTLELLGWFDFEDLGAVIDLELLDPEAVAAAEAAADELRGVGWAPFPEVLHQEVYRFCIETSRRLSPETPVAVCHGTPPTWAALGGMMGMRSDGYICNCGPDSTPGGALYDRLH
jgi:hypothetical protein